MWYTRDMLHLIHLVHLIRWHLTWYIHDMPGLTGAHGMSKGERSGCMGIPSMFLLLLFVQFHHIAYHYIAYGHPFNILLFILYMAIWALLYLTLEVLEPVGVRPPTSSWWPFGLALCPWGLLDLVLWALRALRPCDPRKDALASEKIQNKITQKLHKNHREIQKITRKFNNFHQEIQKKSPTNPPPPRCRCRPTSHSHHLPHHCLCHILDWCAFALDEVKKRDQQTDQRTRRF